MHEANDSIYQACNRNLILVNQCHIGKRLVGYELFSVEKQEIVGLTAKECRDLIANRKAMLYGLELTEDGKSVELAPRVNIMMKSGIAGFTPVKPMDSMLNTIYSLVGMYSYSPSEGETDTMYDLISNRFGRTSMTAAKMGAIMEVGGVINGVCIDSRTGEVGTWLDEFDSMVMPDGKEGVIPAIPFDSSLFDGINLDKFADGGTENVDAVTDDTEASAEAIETAVTEAVPEAMPEVGETVAPETVPEVTDTAAPETVPEVVEKAAGKKKK